VFNNPLSFTDPSGYQTKTEDLEQEGYSTGGCDADVCVNAPAPYSPEKLYAEQMNGLEQSRMFDFINRDALANLNADFTSRYQINQQIEKLELQARHQAILGMSNKGTLGQISALGGTAIAIGGRAAGGSLVGLAEGWGLGNPWVLMGLALVPTNIGDGTLVGNNSNTSRLMFHYSPIAVLNGPLRAGSYLTPFFGYSSTQAVQKLALDGSKVGVQLYIHAFMVSSGQYGPAPYSILGTNIVAPLNGQPGGGIEFVNTVPLESNGSSIPAPR
jgi:hypothetical protein